MIQRTLLAFALSTAGLLGCTSSATTDDSQQSSSDVVGAPTADKCCDPTKRPPPGIEGEWCCGDGSWQYDIGSGNQTVSCSKNGGPGAVCALGDKGEACGGPPPVALCAQCPGDDINTMFKWIDGKPTCECCNAAAPTCGPINGPITCAACKGGKNSYKYVNGKATCECCE